jgi:hypothetical protein
MTELLTGATHLTQHPSLDDAQAKPAESNPPRKER